MCLFPVFSSKPVKGYFIHELGHSSLYVTCIQNSVALNMRQYIKSHGLKRRLAVTTECLMALYFSPCHFYASATEVL
jgi:hypothetical protein